MFPKSGMQAPHKVLLAAGGTGGHLNPAMILAQQLQRKGIEVFFMGGNLSKNRFFQDKPAPFFSVSVSPFKGVSSLPPIIRGIKESYHHLASILPTLVVGFGSFY